MMKNIDFKIFKVSDLFILQRGKCSNASKLEIGGRIPYIGAKYSNNGIMGFYKGNERYVMKGNCICFICDGEGSMGLSFFKESSFIPTTNIIVGYNNKLNKYNAQFIVTILNKVRGK